MAFNKNINQQNDLQQNDTKQDGIRLSDFWQNDIQQSSPLQYEIQQEQKPAEWHWENDIIMAQYKKQNNVCAEWQLAEWNVIRGSEKPTIFELNLWI